MKKLMQKHPEFREGGYLEIKKIMVVLLCLVVFPLLSTGASADPRMETNNDFCHFILDPQNTDNEVFVADCGSVITTVEKAAQTGNAQIKCEENNRVARGYATVTRLIQQEVSPILPGTTIVLTSHDSNTPCTMVESNGRSYTSNNWQSTMKATRTSKKGLVMVQYELFCEEGRQ